MRIIGVIPARYQSTRFPGKPLASIAGMMLIERVWRQVKKSKLLTDVIIATDDKRIFDTAEAFGARVVMTASSCACGTDRLAEVARRHEKKADALINVQGDEPLIAPSLIDNLAATLARDTTLQAVTAAYPIIDRRDVQNPNIVKVVLDASGYALYFSRSAMPYERTAFTGKHLKHMGIYGYRRDFLLKFASWKQTPLEKAEQLEQLRILEKGFRMKVLISRQDSFGVDVPQDIKKIEKILKQ